MSESDLDRISELRKALRSDATIEEAEQWWEMTLAIAHSLEYARKINPREQELVRRLRDTVSQAILDVRETRPSPNTHAARIALMSLQHEIERKTIGVDGWPLRDR